MGWFAPRRKVKDSTAQLPVVQSDSVTQNRTAQNPAEQVLGSQSSVRDGDVRTRLPLPSSSTPNESGPPSVEEHISIPSSVMDLSNSFPSGDFRNGTPGEAKNIKCEVMANWLHAKQEEKIWNSHQPGEGVFVKKSKNNYACSPAELVNDGTPLYKAIAILNVKCAMTVNTRIIKLLLERCEQPWIQIEANLRLQVILDLDALPHCQKNQSAAFISSHRMLVVWEDDPKQLLQRAQYIQDALVKMIWGNETVQEINELATGKKPFVEVSEYDEKVVAQAEEAEGGRLTMMWQTAYTTMTLLLVTVAIGSGWRQVAIQQIQNPNLLRLLFIICIPAQVWLSWFFFQAIIGNLAQICGPIGQLYENTKYYSGKAPRRLDRDVCGSLPHVTIQMPVYKEGLRGVIEPTIRSLKQAISTYEMQGGTANIFINDDGLQSLPDAEAQERQDFYDENSIGWVARPPHNPSGENGRKQFIRRGKFKKASNMNYALRISCRLEEILETFSRHSRWSQLEENEAYNEAMRTAIEERNGELWADGNLRIGDYILLIDSDTRVPNDCLLDAVSEMEQSPQVAILQYSSGVMNVTHSFFENGITFFTNLIYTMIRFAVANGDVAPFVGHNAILRWSALQHVAYECEDDHWEKFWSESTVSEDFDMALRLQSEGYVIRLGAYKGDGYKEGVSLTVYDELARWEKYAYGCNELIFHPLKDWIFKGPFTKLFRTFVMSKIPLPSKLTIMAYIGTYYALGSAWLLTLMNYFLIGFFNGWLDHYYMDSFKIYFAILMIFTGIGNVALAVLRYRLGEASLLPSLVENFKWIPLLTVFLGGVSLHISQALLSHFFSIDMQWGATSKEVENISFFNAVAVVIRKFRWTFLFCFTMTAVMLTCGFAIQEDWQIHLITAVWPMGTVVVNHFLLPIVLNPQLMTFTW